MSVGHVANLQDAIVGWREGFVRVGSMQVVSRLMRISTRSCKSRLHVTGFVSYVILS